MFCKNCGAQNQDGAKFCHVCGAVIEQPQAQPQQPPYQQAYNQQQYAAPQYAAPNATYGYKAPIKNRNIAMCIILSIITCGIYGIVWQISMVDDLNTASGRVGDTNGITVWLLSIITCGIYGWIWMYKAGEKVDMIKTKNGMPSSNSGLVYLLLTFFGLGIVSYCIIQSELNKVASFA